MAIGAAEVAGIVVAILAKAAGPLYEFIKSEIDGGADAEELRKKPVSFYITFGGGEGDAVKVQREVESEMLDPNAE